MSRRTARLGEELREEVARIISSELKDPRIGFVTVTRVSLSPDLRNARVYVGVLGGDKERQKSLAGLRQGAGFLRRLLGQRLRLRHTPELQFEYDTGLDAFERVERIIQETKGAAESPTAAPIDESALSAEEEADDDDDDTPRGS